MSKYALDNYWDRTKRRLSLLEQHLDPMTKRRMTALGICYGSRCLEVGAGGGSVAAWMCEQVGAIGKVVATDINVRLLQELALPNLQFMEHDISVDEMPTGGFDIVHARWLIHHLPRPEWAVCRMICVLRPGGCPYWKMSISSQSIRQTRGSISTSWLH